jgi:hypothetical protein
MPVYEVNLDEFVDKTYIMDPATEDLLSRGSLLEDGMKVLIESATVKQVMTLKMADAEYALARRYNRWCTVSDIEDIGGRVAFIGTYDDGSKLKLVESRDMAWIVKLDSLPEHPQYQDVQTIMVNAMLRGTTIDKGDIETVNSEVHKYIQAILELFPSKFITYKKKL